MLIILIQYSFILVFGGPYVNKDLFKFLIHYLASAQQLDETIVSSTAGETVDILGTLSKARRQHLKVNSRSDYSNTFNLSSVTELSTWSEFVGTEFKSK